MTRWVRGTKKPRKSIVLALNVLLLPAQDHVIQKRLYGGNIKGGGRSDHVYPLLPGYPHRRDALQCALKDRRS